MKYLWMACLGLSSLTVGCGRPEDPLVAQVGPHPITSTTLRTFVEELPQGLRIQETGDAARRRYLQDLIDNHLLLMEARDRGLDTTEAVRAVVQDAVDARVRSLYRTREIASKVEVSAEEVRRYFVAEGFDRARKLNAILVKTRDEIDAVLGKLQAGQPFEEVARVHSMDERSAQRGGELGFIDREMALRLYIPLEVFRTLALGEVSEPLRYSRNWHVVRFTEERPTDYEKYRQFVKSRLFKERLAQTEEEHLEQFKEEFKLRLHPDGLKELVAAYREKVPDVLAASPTALYVYDKGEITVGEVQQILQRLNIYRGLADSAGAVSALRKSILRPFLLQEAARRADTYAEPEIRQLEETKRENVLLEILKKIAVTQHITISEEEARQYYDNHPELFYHEDAVWVQELLLPTEMEARQVRQLLKAGARFEELVDRSLREGAVENKGRFHFHPREKVLYPKLVPAVMAAAQGELVGPVEVKGGYSVFSVLGREGGGIESFAIAGRRARGLLRRQRESQRLEALIKRLRAQHASQIKVYEARLREALPDSLVET